MEAITKYLTNVEATSIKNLLKASEIALRVGLVGFTVMLVIAVAGIVVG